MGSRYQAGTLFVQVVPSYDDFMTRLTRDLKGQLGKEVQAELAKSLGEAGEEGGASLSEGVSKGTRKNAPKVKKAVEGLSRDVEKGLAKNSREVETWEKNLSDRLDRAAKSLGRTSPKIRKELDAIARAWKRQEIDASTAAKRISTTSRKLADAAVGGTQGSTPQQRTNAKKSLGALTGDSAETQRQLAEARRALRQLIDENAKAKRKIADDAAKEARRAAKEEAKAEKEATAAADAESKKRAALARDEAAERKRNAKKAADDAERAERAQTRSAEREAEHRARIRRNADAQTERDAQKLAHRQAVLDMNTRDRALRREERGNGNAASRGASRITGFLTGQRDAQDGANAFRAFNAVALAMAVLLPALVPLLAAVGGAIAAMIPILMGAAAGLGVFALGLSGIKGAVSAMAKQQDAASKSSAAYQNQVRSAGKAVADSARAIERAERSLAKARRGIADAQRTSARQIEDALERQKRAEENLAESQRDAKKAQEDLVQARKDALKDLRDLENAMAGNRLDERQGVIDVFKAQKRNDAVQADPGATNLEREEASIDLERAQLSLKETREAQKDLAEDKAKFDKNGVNGSKGVLAAQEKLNRAIRDEIDARKDVGRAARGLDDARRDAADRMRDALERVRDAEEALADARRGGADAHRAYNEALKGGASAIDEVREAMAKLSPEGQTFAKFIFGLRGEFDKLRQSAQTGLLPGLQAGLEQIMSTYGSGFSDWIKNMSTDLGGLMDRLGRRFSSGGFPEFFAAFGESSRQFTSDALVATTNWLEAFGNIFVIAQPYLEQFSTWLLNLSDRFAKWTASKSGQDSLTNFFDHISSVMGKVGDFFDKSSSGISKLSSALSGIGERVLDGLGKLFEKIGNVDQGVVTTVVASLISLFVAAQLATGLVALVTIIGLIAGAPVLAAAAAIAAIAGAFYLMGDNKKLDDLKKSFEPIVTIVNDLWTMIKDQLMKTWNETLVPGFEKLVKILKKDFLPSLSRFWKLIKPFVKFIASGIGDMIRTGIGAVFDIIGGLVKLISGLMDVIVGVFTGNWSLVGDGLKKIFKGLVKIVWGALKLIFVITPGKLLGIGGKLIVKLVGKIFGKFVPGAIKGASAAVGIAVEWLLGKVRTRFTNFVTNIGAILGKIGGFFKKLLPKGVVENIQKAFAKLKGFIVDPIKSAVQIVINGGIFAAIRKIKKIFGIGDPDTPKNITFSSGKKDNEEGDRDWAASTRKNTGSTPTPRNQTVGGRGFARHGNAAGGKNRPPAASSGSPHWPANTKLLSGNYAGHSGVDIAAANGSPITAAGPGVIEYVGTGRGYGNAIFQALPGGIMAVYGHTSRTDVKAGQSVKAGDKIGNVGWSGNVRPAGPAGAHLHFEVNGAGPFGSAANRNATLAWLSGASFSNKGGNEASKTKEDPSPSVRKILSGASGKLGSLGEFGAMFTDLPKKFLGTIVSWGKSKVGLGSGPKTLYDSGGWLRPGYTSVHNASGKPEPVFSAAQWQVLEANLRQTVPSGNKESHYHWHEGKGTPEEFAGAINRMERRQARQTRPANKGA